MCWRVGPPLRGELVLTELAASAAMVRRDDRLTERRGLAPVEPARALLRRTSPPCFPPRDDARTLGSTRKQQFDPFDDIGGRGQRGGVAGRRDATGEPPLYHGPKPHARRARSAPR